MLGGFARWFGLALVLAGGLATPAVAQTPTLTVAELPPSGIDGADDPVFRAAAVRWLNGDDARALPVLAVLANGDNLAAQILLGTIDARVLNLSPWPASLAREEFQAIFRRMDRPFGTRWLKVAAERSRLAELIGAPEPDAEGRFSADDALKLAALGEPRATVMHLNTMLNQGDWVEALRLAEVAKVYDMEGMIWAIATYVDDFRHEGLRARGIAAFEAGSLQGWLFASLANRREDAEFDALIALQAEMVTYLVLGRLPIPIAPPAPLGGEAVLDALLAEAPQAAILRQYCARECPGAAGETAACVRDLYGRVSGYATLPYVTASPLESVIPQNIYAQTRRAEMALEKYALSIANVDPDPAQRLAALEIDACLADALRPALVLP